jgi:hypothetical protein
MRGRREPSPPLSASLDRKRRMMESVVLAKSFSREELLEMLQGV